jgi:hypothetical protein
MEECIPGLEVGHRLDEGRENILWRRLLSLRSWDCCIDRRLNLESHVGHVLVELASSY